jgi:hypothetical protein
MKNITLSIIVLLFSLTSISQQIISVSPNLSYDFINTANSNLVSPDIIYTVGSGKATGQTEFIPWTMRSVNGGVNWNVFKKNNLYYMVFFNKDTALALTNRLYDNNSKYYTVISSTKNNFTNYDSIVLDSNAYNVDLIKGNNCIYLTFRTYAQPDSQATYRSVFPNPAKEEVNIQTSGFFNMNTSIRVYDAAGKQVLETKLQIPQTTIDISGLDKGIYFLKILNGDGEFVEKLIKD